MFLESSHFEGILDNKFHALNNPRCEFFPIVFKSNVYTKSMLTLVFERISKKSDGHIMVSIYHYFLYPGVTNEYATC